METTRDPRGVPTGDGAGGHTPHDKQQLQMTSSPDPTPGFRLIYRPDPPLQGVETDQSEVAFVIEKPRSAYRYDLWTRHGQREGVSLETFQSVYAPRSQRIAVPEPVQMAVRDVWQRGGDVTAELERLHPIMQHGSQDPRSEVVSRG